ncbi:MAG TPA: YdcF family protein, partial [Abditibacteriaceae bacterium]|nr:YdcF family protein [Abditibacteriaceae bacterium]
QAVVMEQHDDAPHDDAPHEDASRTSRRPLRFIAPAVVLPLLGFAGLMWFLDSYGQRERARPSDAIVVLGARVVPPGMAGLSLRARTLKAVELYRKGLAPKIICTGGVGDFPPAEGQVAANLAMRHGVPARDVLYEDTSTSTLENAQNAARICRMHHWQRIIVVSDPYHLWRAQRNFQSLGLTAFPSPATNRPIGSRLWNTAREALCVLRDMIVWW